MNLLPLCTFCFRHDVCYPAVFAFTSVRTGGGSRFSSIVANNVLCSLFRLHCVRLHCSTAEWHPDREKVTFMLSRELFLTLI